MLAIFQLRRLNELEDIVAEQDNSLAALRDKLSKSRQEMQEWKLKHGEAVKQAADEKQRQVIQHHSFTIWLYCAAGFIEQFLRILSDVKINYLDW